MKGNSISIRYFDNLVGMIMGHPPEACGMSGVCACSYVVEATGNIYPCDFYVIDDWILGNIHENGFEEMKLSNNGVRFIEVSKKVSPQCEKCPYFQLCRGGCRRNREPFENGLPALNYFCPSFKEFFSYASGRLEQIARMISMNSSHRT